MQKKVNGEDIENNLGGTWKQAILSAYNSTKKANPNSEVWAYLDRKSFKGWQRNAIKNYLDENNIPLGRTDDF